MFRRHAKLVDDWSKRKETEWHASLHSRPRPGSANFWIA
jgi:hypothetical protein